MNLLHPLRRGYLLFTLFLVSGFSPVYAYSHSNDRASALFWLVAGLIGGVVLFFWGFSQWRTRRLMEDIPTSTIRAMAPGLVEISGKAVNWSLFQGPFTREDCVYYEYLVEQLVSSGKSSHWETILKGSSKTYPFFVQDDTGMALVQPEGAQVLIPDDYVLKTGLFTDVPGHVVAFLDQNNISCRTFFGFEKTLRFTEKHFLPGETVFVMGTCQETQANPLNPPAGAIPGICLAKGERHGDVFILSDESQKELESSFGWHALFGIFGGLFLIGGCLYLLLHMFIP
jgi:hypothetical protein